MTKMPPDEQERPSDTADSKVRYDLYQSHLLADLAGLALKIAKERNPRSRHITRIIHQQNRTSLCSNWI